MAVVKTKLGMMPCPCCGHPVMVRENDRHTLTIACDGCDISAFAKAGTEAQARWRAVLPGTVPKEVPPAVPAAPKAPPLGPVPKAKPAGVFDFLTQGAK